MFHKRVCRSAWLLTLGAFVLPAAPAFAQGLVQNPDFEAHETNPNFPDLWFRGGSVGYVTNDDSDGAGTASVFVGNGGDYRSRAFPVLAGEAVTFALDFKVASGSSGTFRTDLRFFTDMAADGGTGGEFRGEFAPTTDVAAVGQGFWQVQGPSQVIVPAGANFADVRISAGIFGAPLSGQVNFDNVRVIPEPSCLALVCTGVALARRRRVARA